MSRYIRFFNLIDEVTLLSGLPRTTSLGRPLGDKQKPAGQLVSDEGREARSSGTFRSAVLCRSQFRFCWCLSCFEVPGRDHHVWRHGRGDGVRPAKAMPPGLRDAILRAPLRPELPPAVHERWLELVAVLPFSR